jgi:hypothetical protein
MKKTSKSSNPEASYTIHTILFCLALAVLISLVSCDSKSGHMKPKAKLRIAAFAQPPTGHICKDLNHIKCDGECTCDGMECPSPMPQIVIKQINVTPGGYISCRYISTDGEEYAYDHMTSEQFHNIFGFLVSTEE